MAGNAALGRLALRRRSDESVFARALEGDPLAFSEVYRRYHPRVYGFCLARLMDRDAASDAAQEVFVRLLRAESGTVEHPRAWLFAVARNVVTDVVRAKSRTPEPADPGHEAAVWETLAAADSAEEMLTREGARTVFLALRRIKPRHRTALILREMHGQSSADMGDALGIKPGAVDALVCRARDAFGRAYAEVSELPAGCRDGVELLYRRHGSGLTPAEDARLGRHLETCPRCGAERGRVDDARRLPALLPFLLPARPTGDRLLAEAVRLSNGLPETLAQPALVTPSVAPAARAAAVVLAAALVVAPPSVSAPAPATPGGLVSAGVETAAAARPSDASIGRRGDGGVGDPDGASSGDADDRLAHGGRPAEAGSGKPGDGHRSEGSGASPYTEGRGAASSANGGRGSGPGRAGAGVPPHTKRGTSAKGRGSSGGGTERGGRATSGRGRGASSSGASPGRSASSGHDGAAGSRSQEERDR